MDKDDSSIVLEIRSIFTEKRGVQFNGQYFSKILVALQNWSILAHKLWRDETSYFIELFLLLLQISKCFCSQI